MKIWREISNFNARNPVITIGIFDGVHRGHIFLLEKLKKEAEKFDGETVVVSLWPHPRLVLNKNPDKLRYLTSIEEKIILLEKAGVDHLVIIPFTMEFSRLSSCEFIERYLVNNLKVKKLLVGFNHKFGKNREGDFHNLKTCADRFGFELEKLSPVKVNDEKLSSSIIRDLILEGKLEKANGFLGYDFFLRGKVVEGNKIGRQMGFPTANIQPDDEHKLIPKPGVYAVQVQKDKSVYNGMLNIGFRPTVNTGIRKKSIEVHLFDYKGDMYGAEVSILFRAFMREENKFDSLDELKEQLVMDKQKAIEILKDFN
ncbi:MAG: bifunctional riboflavin kinase/FAD synthetase [Bacteroidales bacterium]